MRGAAGRAPAAAAAQAASRPRGSRSLRGTAPASGTSCGSTSAASIPISPSGDITNTTGRTPAISTRGTIRLGTSTRRRRTVITTRGITRLGTSTRRRRTVITTRGTTRHGTDPTMTAAGPTRADRTITAGTTTRVEGTTTARAEASRSDRFDALDVPHDPGALGLLRLHHPRAGWERHLAEL